METMPKIPYKLICMACLSSGNSIRIVTDNRLKQFYLNSLNENPPVSIAVNLSLHVCWECEVLLKKVVDFQEQVKNSYKILQIISVENLNECFLTDVTRSPRLSLKVNSPISIQPDNGNQLLDVKEEMKVEWGDNETSRRYVKTNGTPNPVNEIASETQDNLNLNNSLTEFTVPGDTKDKDSPSDNEYIDAIGVEIEALVSKVKKKKRSKVSSKLKKAKKVVKKLRNGLKTKRSKKIEDQNILTIDLSYEEMLIERERESSRESYVKAEYKCDSCLMGFNYKKSYKAHQAAKHSPDRGEYICPICKTILSSVDSFTAHYRRHMRRYECGICQKRTMDIKVMQQHYYSTHEISLKEYKCDVCGKISNSIDTHRYHKDTHKARVQCTECDKTFTHRAGLLNHRLSVHELNNAFPCTICDKVFRWKTSLKRHLEKHDAKDKSASAAYCSECGVTFSSVCSYQRHMKNSLKHVTPEQLRFICDHCNRRFADKTKLRDHIEEKHLYKTFKCHICLKPSKNRVGLDQHIRNVHKGRPNNKMCHHCGKAFPTKVQLESHIRTHTGERPFSCEFCPTTFSQQSNLYKHNRQVHLNIKSKRYPVSTPKKRKQDRPTDPPQEITMDPYRPVAVLQYTADSFVM